MHDEHSLSFEFTDVPVFAIDIDLFMEFDFADEICVLMVRVHNL